MLKVYTESIMNVYEKIDFVYEIDRVVSDYLCRIVEINDYKRIIDYYYKRVYIKHIVNT